MKILDNSHKTFQADTHTNSIPYSLGKDLSHPDNHVYEVIENESLKSCDFDRLTLSGSLFSLTVFKNVTFRSCVFFGSKLENCRFVNCKFIDCSFQFTNLAHCNFHTTEFKNCHWDFSYTRKSQFHHCSLDKMSHCSISKDDNRFVNCFTKERSLEEACGFNQNKAA